MLSFLGAVFIVVLFVGAVIGAILLYEAIHDINFKIKTMQNQINTESSARATVRKELTDRINTIYSTTRKRLRALELKADIKSGDDEKEAG